MKPPDRDISDYRKGLRYSEEACQLEPRHGLYLNTLGVAHYRAGNWKDAALALDRSRELRQGGDAFDFFFLAMAHWRLRQKDDARKWYKQAVEWVEKNSQALAKDPQHTDELRRFRVEAEELLGTKN